MTWTTSADIRAKVQRIWDDGSLLRAYASGDEFRRLEHRLRGPSAAEVGERLADVQRWKAELTNLSRDGSRYSLELSTIGGRVIGRTLVPSRAVIETYAQAWALLGTRDLVAQYDEILVRATVEPAVHAWVREHPRKAIALSPEWPQLLAAYRWLRENRGSGRYLREITAPGVDTKFAEQHRSVLAALLDTSATASGFLTDLGLRLKPAFTRIRPHPDLHFAGGLSELAVRHAELADLDLQAERAVIVENEISYLSAPVPPGGVVIWGKGFDLHDVTGGIPWLRASRVTYWGDLDTHGFAILNRVRSWLPQTTSELMDLDTLLAHQERWGTEDRPTHATLTHLTPQELEVYSTLVEDRVGVKVRLEQERIDWAWAMERLCR